jgi:hypothetical protein
VLGAPRGHRLLPRGQLGAVLFGEAAALRPFLLEVVAAQRRYAEVGAAIAEAPDRASAVTAVSVLLEVDERFGEAVVDLPLWRLSGASARQGEEDLAEIARWLHDHKAGDGDASG